MQVAVMKAINRVLGAKSTVLHDMASIMEKSMITEKDGRITVIDSRLKLLQKELVSRATAKQNFDDLTDELYRLREEKERILVEQAEDKGKQLKREELVQFLGEQTMKVEEFDDKLVRKLIEQVIIHANGTFTVEFKSGTKVEVN